VLTAVELSLLRSSAHSQLWCSLGLRVARSLAFTVALLSSHCTKIQGSPWDISVLIETEQNSFYIVLGKEKAWIDCGWLAGVGRMSLDIKWQLFFHGEALSFPVLLSLARDYLACASSSEMVERTFSVASNICTSAWSSLAPRTIEQCISSHLWLCNGVKAQGDFDDYLAVLEAANNNSKLNQDLIISW
jgi:hypothetical protein